MGKEHWWRVRLRSGSSSWALVFMGGKQVEDEGWHRNNIDVALPLDQEVAFFVLVNWASVVPEEGWLLRGLDAAQLDGFVEDKSVEG